MNPIIGHAGVNKQWEKAVADFDKALQLQPAKAGDCNTLAWYLATCPDPRVRKPDRAVQLAAQATQLAPNGGANWNTLGVAQYRAGQFKQAVTSLSKSMQLRSGGDAFDWFFLAMAHWQLKNKEEARKWYDKAVGWMEKSKPDDEELRRFRAEAAELLGIVKNEKKPPAGKEKTEAKPKAESGKRK